MLLGIIVSILEKLGLALLGTFFQSTAKSAQDAGVDASALDYIAQLVAEAEADPALVDGDAKYNWVFGQAVAYFKSRGIDLAITLMESIMGLAVHSFHTTANIQHKTISSIATPAPAKP